MPGFSTLRFRDIQRLSETLEKDIELYVLENSPNVRLFHARKKKYKNEPLRLLIDDGDKNADTVIWPILIIHNERVLGKRERCPNFGCYFEGDQFARHITRCSKEKSPIISKQVAYGERSDIIWELVNARYLPNDALNFRKNKFGKNKSSARIIIILVCFDIETFERLSQDRTENTQVHASHRLLSIAIGSNFGYESVIVREDDSPEAAKNMVSKFVNQLKMVVESVDAFPEYFHYAILKLESETEHLRFGAQHVVFEGRFEMENGTQDVLDSSATIPAQFVCTK